MSTITHDCYINDVGFDVNTVERKPRYFVLVFHMHERRVKRDVGIICVFSNKKRYPAFLLFTARMRAIETYHRHIQTLATNGRSEGNESREKWMSRYTSIATVMNSLTHLNSTKCEARSNKNDCHYPSIASYDNAEDCFHHELQRAPQ